MDDITLEIAIQLIADKKAKGPVRKKNYRRKN
jgi:topoisomerase IA-like protein